MCILLSVGGDGNLCMYKIQYKIVIFDVLTIKNHQDGSVSTPPYGGIVWSLKGNVVAGCIFPEVPLENSSWD